MRILRILGLFLLAGLLFWLWHDAQPKHKLESGLRHGYIGGLTKAEKEAFGDALSFVTSGVRSEGISVALNKSGGKTALQVLTITDAGSAEFHCGPGNAAYDPHLDAILVHVDLVRAWLAPEYAVTELFSSRKAFFIFLLLHELGHRTKHGSLRNMYGAMASDGDRLLEEEADQYAFSQIEGLAEHPLIIQQGARAPSQRSGSLLLDHSFYSILISSPIPFSQGVQNQTRNWKQAFERSSTSAQQNCALFLWK